MTGRKWAFGLLLAVLVLSFATGTAQSAITAGYQSYLAANTVREINEGVTLWSGEADARLKAEVPFTFTMEEDGFGYLMITYAMTENNILNNRFSLTLDGVIPYVECTSLTLDASWRSPASNPIDRYGNEVLGMPIKEYDVLRQIPRDNAALYSQGLGLALTQGEHTLTITAHEGPFTLYQIELVPAPQLVEDVSVSLTGDALIAVQAEDVNRRNNPNIRPASLHDTQLTPFSSERKIINYIEDWSYRYGGDKLYYDFEVEEAGYYGLALRMRQSNKANFPVLRTIYIDGEIPSKSFFNAAFNYSQHFTNQIVTTQAGETAVFYLAEGAHTLCIQTSLDAVRHSIEVLTEVSIDIAGLALEISKITGGNTDYFREFSLEDFDIDAYGRLAECVERLESEYAVLVALCGGVEAGEISGIRVALELLELLMEDPDDLPKQLNKLSNGSSSARSYLINTAASLSESPMGLDAIYLFQDEQALPTGMGLMDSVIASAELFLRSFSTGDYEAVSSQEASSLQVWVNRPRQYLEIMQRMADASFTAETGIKVDFSLMPDVNKLVLANASGSAPDVAVAIPAGLTFELAIRGALRNMREFDNFKEVASRFPVGLLMPSVCDDGLYALPETFNFTVLFYREDILDALGLAVPDSMEDVLAMLPTLRRYGLNFNNFVSNSIGYKALNITTPYIFQSGGTLYANDSYLSALGSENALAGIKLLTDSFIVYDMEYEVNSFYQAFRDGTLPIGTGDYVMYNLLMNAAPELTGRWNIALYPGITNDEGDVMRYTSNAAESSVIFASGNKQEESWLFLDWWMSDAVQTEFAYVLQATLGNEYLWNSANIQAYKNSPWPAQSKDVISEQLTWAYDAPRSLEIYMVERELSNAINAIVLEGKNLRMAMDDAILRIDREVTRKLEEFGRLENGELTVPFTPPTIEKIKGWLE